MAGWLREEFEFLPNPGVTLLRSYTNDVYLVEQGERKFVLKVYGQGWRTRDEIGYEIELTDHLARAGAGVARVIGGPRVRETPDARLAVLFEHAPGAKPERPFTTELYICFGRAIATVHQLSDDFVASHARRAIDLEYLIDEPLEVILPLLGEAAEFLDVATQLKHRIAEFAGLDWGAIHGDATLDNLHITEAGDITLYDFDSGGPGWRASDLQGWAVNRPDAQERYEAFLAGYASVRPLNEQDLEASPLITAAWEIWSIKLELERRVIQRGHDGAITFAAQEAERVTAQIRTVLA